MGKALILVSGPTNPNADGIIRESLRDYVHHEIAMQRIDLGGRTIVAMLMELDPAHFNHIEKELLNACTKVDLDLGMELL